MAEPGQKLELAAALGAATCTGVAGVPAAGAAHVLWASQFWPSGTGTWLCLQGSSLWVIGTDLQEHQINPI